MQYVGSGVIGKSAPTLSTANLELVPATVQNLKRIVFKNTELCTIKVNGSNPIYLNAGQGFSTEIGELLIYSFVVVEANITYIFHATY
jgi:hypothetical protein